MRKGFLIYEEMRKYFPIYEEAVCHIWLCNCSTLNFLIYEENLIWSVCGEVERYCLYLTSVWSYRAPADVDVHGSLAGFDAGGGELGRDGESTAPPHLAPPCRARIFKRLWSPGINSKEWIPPAYVAWRPGTITIFLLGSYSPHRLFKNSSSELIVISFKKSPSELQGASLIFASKRNGSEHFIVPDTSIFNQAECFF